MPRIAFIMALTLSATAAVWAPPAAADSVAAPALPFLGEQPNNAAAKAGVLGDMRRIAPGELDALMEITLLCELDRATLSRRATYDPWEKRCTATEGKWQAGYSKATAPRAIDQQMRLYFTRRLSLRRAATDYFAAKDAIEQNRRQRKNIRKDVEAAVTLRKDLSMISAEMLKFFFALRDLADQSRR